MRAMGAATRKGYGGIAPQLPQNRRRCKFNGLRMTPGNVRANRS